jgi:hypothetical protein
MKNKINLACCVFGVTFAIILTRFMQIAKSYRDNAHELNNIKNLLADFQNNVSSQESNKFTYNVSKDMYFEMQSFLKKESIGMNNYILPNYLSLEILILFCVLCAIIIFILRLECKLSCKRPPRKLDRE